MAKLVSTVYGDALFSLALEKDELDVIWEEVKTIRQAVEENKEFLKLLSHPYMTEDKKCSLLKEVFGDALSQDTMGLLHVMVRKGRIGELLSVLDYFDEQAKAYKKIGVVFVTTPIAMTDSQKQQVEERLRKTTPYETLEMNYQVDKSILGGIIIRIGDQILDNSIRSQMESMSRKLMNVKLPV